MGPALVQNLDGSERAKRRLEVILATITGQMTIEQACDRLAIGQSRFYKLRTEVLEASLKHLEPRAMGRPAHVQTAEEARCEELQEQVERLEAELKISEVREEIARTMPHLAEDRERLKKRNPRRRSPKDVAQSGPNGPAGDGNGDQRQRQSHEAADRRATRTDRSPIAARRRLRPPGTTPGGGGLGAQARRDGLRRTGQ